MRYDVSTVGCGGAINDHALVAAGGLQSPCLICELRERNEALLGFCETAAMLLVEGKAVQAHRLLVDATGQAPSPAPKEEP